jgi:hypothetical protein
MRDAQQRRWLLNALRAQVALLVVPYMLRFVLWVDKPPKWWTSVLHIDSEATVYIGGLIWMAVFLLGLPILFIVFANALSHVLAKRHFRFQLLVGIAWIAANGIWVFWTWRTMP